MQENQFYEGVLGLTEEWAVEGAEKDEGAKRITIRIGSKLKAHPCPLCGAGTVLYGTKEREVRHLDMCAYKTFLVIKVPRVKCPEHGVNNIAVLFADRRGHFTHEFEKRVLELCEGATIKKVSVQIRGNGEELARLIEYTPWSRREHEESYTATESDIENARRFLVRSWMSIGSCVYRTGWRHNIKNKSFGIYQMDKMPDAIKAVSRRLRPKSGNVVQIENRDAFSLIEQYNRPNVLMYLDPPYVMNTRKNKKIYRHEFSDDDHIRLCEMINGSAAKVELSGYANSIYEERLRGFSKTAFSSFDETGRQRTEVVWTNYPTAGDLFDQDLYGETAG